MTLARALAHAHSQKILHRDIKPANVLLTVRDGPQLLDFNLAHDPDSPDQAAAALRGGTLPYMAPEQLEAFLDAPRWGRVGASADVYSLGLLLRELLTGQAPDTPDCALTLPRAIRALLDRRALPLVPLRRLNPAIPHALEAIVARCVEFSPAQRYAGAASLADDLERFLSHNPLQHATNRSARERLGNWGRRNYRGVAVALAVLTGIGAAAYQPIVRNLVPVERFAAFHAAVDAVDTGRALEAIPHLQELTADFPRAALPRFYLSLALERQNNLQGASQQFATMLGLPGAEAMLHDWERRHAGVAEQLETFGSALLAARQVDLAGRAFRIALRQDPRLPLARQGSAAVHEFNRDFASAHRLLSGLIEEAATRKTSDDRWSLVNWYCMRAQVAVRWGEEMQGLDASRTSDGPEKRYQEALVDLDRAAQLIGPYDQKHANQVALVRVAALNAVGRVDALHGRKNEARRRHQEARQVLARVEPLSPEEGIEIRKLKQKLAASQ
jgi:tetratricopeptide (TPR) repeat protein